MKMWIKKTGLKNRGITICAVAKMQTISFQSVQRTFLFQKLKVVLKVRRFNIVPMIQAMHLLSFKQCTS